MGRNLSFRVDKCKVLHYGKGNIEYKSSTCGQQLDEVESEKHLGIFFSKNLKLAAQCNEAYTKVHRMLGLISRTIKCTNVESLKNLHKLLVIQHLEYYSSYRILTSAKISFTGKSSTPLYAYISGSQTVTI